MCVCTECSETSFYLCVCAYKLPSVMCAYLFGRFASESAYFSIPFTVALKVYKVP